MIQCSEHHRRGKIPSAWEEKGWSHRPRNVSVLRLTARFLTGRYPGSNMEQANCTYRAIAEVEQAGMQQVTEQRTEVTATKFHLANRPEFWLVGVGASG